MDKSKAEQLRDLILDANANLQLALEKIHAAKEMAGAEGLGEVAGHLVICAGRIDGDITSSAAGVPLMEALELVRKITGESW